MALSPGITTRRSTAAMAESVWFSKASSRPSSSPTVLRSATDAAVLVVQTGWDAHWGDPTYRDHPYLTRAAAEFCFDQGYDVAVDALNPDPTPTADASDDESEGFPVHHELLGSGHLIFENLTNLEGVPERFELVAHPLKLAARDGAPVRAVARHE